MTADRADLSAERLTTPRLVLEPLAVSDAEEMTRLLADLDLYRFTGGTPPAAGALRDRYQRFQEGPGAPNEWWLNWVIRLADEGRLVGTVQASASLVGDELVADIAWIIASAHQGRGFAKEAAAALVDWLRVHRVAAITAGIHPQNLASGGVAAACGLRPTDELANGERVWRLDF